MNITCSITNGMTPQEKKIYFVHMEKRHREEAEKIDAEKERLRTYKQSLIEDIMKANPESDIEYLQKLTTRSLERIAYR